MAEASEARLPDAPVPAHVPPELVFDVRHYTMPNALDEPFSVTSNVFNELPPLAFTPHGTPGLYSGAWVVSRYEDIRDVYQNDELYSTKGAADFASLVGETFRMIPLALDPPEHMAYRVMLNSWFSPKAINGMEPAIRSTINTLLDSFVDKGECAEQLHLHARERAPTRSVKRRREAGWEDEPGPDRPSSSRLLWSLQACGTSTTSPTRMVRLPTSITSMGSLSPAARQCHGMSVCKRVSICARPKDDRPGRFSAVCRTDGSSHVCGRQP